MGWLTDRVQRLLIELRERFEIFAPYNASKLFLTYKWAMENVSDLESISYDAEDLDQRKMSIVSNIYSIRICEGFLRQMIELSGTDGLSLLEEPPPFHGTFSLLEELERGLNELKAPYKLIYDVDGEDAPSIKSITIRGLLHNLPASELPDAGLTKLVIESTETLPAILYHPRETPGLIRQLIDYFHQDFGTDGYLFLKPSVEDGSLALRITMRGSRMTPATWNRLWTPLFEEQYEHLREFGGSIEPLTWDEGYGQGVIVRLPWASISP